MARCDAAAPPLVGMAVTHFLACLGYPFEPMIQFILALGVAFLMTSAVHGQTPTDPQSRIAASLQRAAAAGIPAELLQLKVQEGRAKGVPGERIAAAVERRERSLIHARRQLAGVAGIGSQELSVAADALEAGISAAALRQVASGAPPERRVVAIAVLTQLAQLGTPVEMAVAQTLDEVSGAGSARGQARAAGLGGARPGERGPPDHAGAAGPAGIISGPPASLPQPSRRGNSRPGRKGA